MKRLYLTLDDRLYQKIMELAGNRGIPPSSLVVGNLEDLYLKTDAINYDKLLEKIYKEAQERDNTPFILSDLPSFSELIVTNAAKAHIGPSTLRARIGKTFNAAVKEGKVGNVVRAKKANGDLLNKAGVAMYINEFKGE